MVAKSRIKAEDGSAAWLRYHPLSRRSAAERARFLAWQGLLARIIIRGGHRADPVFATAVSELKHGLKKLMGFEPAIEFAQTAPADRGAGSGGGSRGGWNPADEGFGFAPAGDDRPGLELSADHARGLLYGVFHLLEILASGLGPQDLAVSSQPVNPLRMLDHWDNMDGSVERGYAGRSIFFRSGKLARREPDLRRLSHYARLLASVGINALAINNVNVHARETWLVTPTHQADLVRIAGIFRAWGIRIFLSVNYAAPLQVGGIATADPLDKPVAAWWEVRARELWAAIPDFGGWLVKADSEGRPGPFTYGRSHADGANMLARAVGPHGGIVLWRCFVYNCRQDWRDRKTDRARAAYDHFMPLDGAFDDNVLLQIKNGPMDFQVREPVSPLLGGMNKTNQLLELQITQEYTGQQRHVCCLLPQWREVLDFPTHALAEKGNCPVAEVASGQVFSRHLGGMTAVANIGDDANWTGHHLAQVNLFGFGRLAWNPASPVGEIIDRWTALSFGSKPELVAKIGGMLAASWKTYESYTAPLGVGWMVNPEHHYGPNVDGYEYSRWGTYHFADRHGIGVDRSRLLGTGYSGQYHEPWASHYDDRSLCADELLLFFHHVAWNHRLHSGKTVIQHIYDSHFAGVLEVAGFVDLWRGLSGYIDGRRHREVLERLEHQLAHAAEWRDQINTYCYRKSGIGDAAGRPVY